MRIGHQLLPPLPRVDLIFPPSRTTFPKKALNPTEKMLTEDLEIKLNVWKELAISKQMLIRAATDALKLDPDTSPEELKLALEAAIDRAAQADTDVGKAKDEAKQAIAAMEKKLTDCQKSMSVAEAARAEALATQETLQQKVINGRESAARELNECKQRLAEKERALKAINTALSDTPENVLKALKTLKRQKIEESDARKQAEKDAAALRKDKKKLEQDLKDVQAAQESAMELAARYRELHALCETQRTQLEPLVEDKDGLPVVPNLDQNLLESIEKAGAAEEKKPRAKAKR